MSTTEVNEINNSQCFSGPCLNYATYVGKMGSFVYEYPPRTTSVARRWTCVVQHPRVMCLNGQLPNLISVVGSLIVLDFVVFMVG